ncbi:MAG: hypothetical protein M3O86_05105 [Actinomycetota bacterium]|nr:hypothetical protein [Actinomycetota bacterium]
MAAGAALSLVPVATGAAGADGTLPPAKSSKNFELVAHVPDKGGTDLEFFSRSLTTYRDASGATIASETPVERHFAMVGNQTTGAKISDVTTPEQPFLASALQNCTVGQGDVQVTADGMLAAIAWQTSGSCKSATGTTLKKGSILVDLSDVYAPAVVSGAPDTAGAHNNTLHPSGKYLYISTSGITDTNAKVPIYDVTNPAAPKLVKIWSSPGNSPHDIRFSDDGTRAYLAGISQYRILDTTNPEDPKLISTIVPPGGTIGHDTLVTPDKAFLFIGDEGGGGGTYPCPGGAIYVYDIRNEVAPVLLGVAEAGGGPVTDRQLDEPAPGTVRGGCTAHVMALNPNNKSLTLGWYTLGTRTFDFSALYGADGKPKTGPALSYGFAGVGMVENGYIIPEGGNTWSAKQYAKVPGYIFSDDLNLGFYVTKIKS